MILHCVLQNDIVCSNIEPYDIVQYEIARRNIISEDST